MTYTYSKDHHVENDHRNILVRAWLAWEDVVGKMLGLILERLRIKSVILERLKGAIGSQTGKDPIVATLLQDDKLKNQNL